MKKYIYILAGAALLAACEQKTETTAPAASPATSPESTVATSPAEMASPAEVTSPTPTP